MEDDLLGPSKPPFPEDFKSPVGDWLDHKQSMANQAGTNLRNFRERDPPVSRLVTLYWFTIHAYPHGPTLAYRTLILGPNVSSG